jgi:hypothetical protein
LLLNTDRLWIATVTRASGTLSQASDCRSGAGEQRAARAAGPCGGIATTVKVRPILASVRLRMAHRCLPVVPLSWVANRLAIVDSSPRRANSPRVVDGKVDEFWVSPDRMTIMQQIGALPTQE